MNCTFYQTRKPIDDGYEIQIERPKTVTNINSELTN